MPIDLNVRGACILASYAKSFRKSTPSICERVGFAYFCSRGITLEGDHRVGSESGEGHHCLRRAGSRLNICHGIGEYCVREAVVDVNCGLGHSRGSPHTLVSGCIPGCSESDPRAQRELLNDCSIIKDCLIFKSPRLSSSLVEGLVDISSVYLVICIIYHNQRE